MAGEATAEVRVRGVRSELGGLRSDVRSTLDSVEELGRRVAGLSAADVAALRKQGYQGDVLDQIIKQAGGMAPAGTAGAAPAATARAARDRQDLTADLARIGGSEKIAALSARDLGLEWERNQRQTRAWREELSLLERQMVRLNRTDQDRESVDRRFQQATQVRQRLLAEEGDLRARAEGLDMNVTRGGVTPGRGGRGGFGWRSMLQGGGFGPGMGIPLAALGIAGSFATAAGGTGGDLIPMGLAAEGGMMIGGPMGAAVTGGLAFIANRLGREASESFGVVQSMNRITMPVGRAAGIESRTMRQTMQGRVDTRYGGIFTPEQMLTGTATYARGTGRAVDPLSIDDLAAVTGEDPAVVAARTSGMMRAGRMYDENFEARMFTAFERTPLADMPLLEPIFQQDIQGLTSQMAGKMGAVNPTGLAAMAAGASGISIAGVDPTSPGAIDAAVNLTGEALGSLTNNRGGPFQDVDMIAMLRMGSDPQFVAMVEKANRENKGLNLDIGSVPGMNRARQLAGQWATQPGALGQLGGTILRGTLATRKQAFSPNLLESMLQQTGMDPTLANKMAQSGDIEGILAHAGETVAPADFTKTVRAMTEREDVTQQRVNVVDPELLKMQFGDMTEKMVVEIKEGMNSLRRTLQDALNAPVEVHAPGEGPHMTDGGKDYQFPMP